MTKESYSKLAMNAMNRASKQALEKAANMDLKLSRPIILLSEN